MNTDLQHRLKRGESPFAGPILVLEGPLQVDLLLNALRIAVEVVRKTFASPPLQVNVDWHEHDGVILPARTITWAEVDGWLGSVHSLLDSSSDDWRVYTLLFPDDFAFCLRYCINVDDGIEPRCRLDFSADPTVVATLAEALIRSNFAPSYKPSSAAYLQERGAA